MKAAAFGFRTNNIGDDMQTLAAALELRGVERLIDRDAMAEESLAKPHAVIFNSWFMKGADFRTPPETIVPIFHGFALGKDELLASPWLDYLRAHAPIGCRDQESVTLLSAHGVEAHWSGCLTLFIGRAFIPVPAHARTETLFLDIDPKTEERCIPAPVRERAVRLSMFPPPAIRTDRISRFVHLAAVVERLRRAKLVVTRRLHAALPAVGFATPTIVLPDPAISNARRRYSGFLDLLPGAMQDDDVAIAAIDWDEVAAPAIPDTLVAAHRALQERLGRLRVRAPFSPRAAALTDPSTVSNPGLGARPGQAVIVLGEDRCPAPVLNWTESSIGIDWRTPFAGAFAFELELESEGGVKRRLAL